MQSEYQIAAQERLVEQWERFSVRVPDIEVYLGHPVAEMTDAEHQQLEEELTRAEQHATRSGKPTRWILRKRDPPKR